MRLLLWAFLVVVVAVVVGYVFILASPKEGYEVDSRRSTSSPHLDYVVASASKESMLPSASSSLDQGNSVSEIVFPPDTSLVHIIPILSGQNRVNGEVAKRLANDLLVCYDRLVASAIAKGMLGHGDSIANKTVRKAQEQERELGKVDDRLAASEALCMKVDDAFIRNVAFDVLLGAAKAGDEAAAACFVSGDLFSAQGGANERERLLAVYRANALELARAGVERGDWRMVRLMALMYSAGGNAFVRSLVPPSGLAVYSWLRLARLSAVGRDADRLDRGLMAVRRGLSAGAVESADAWASAMFNAYFAERPAYTDARATPCIIQGERQDAQP